MDCGQEDTPGGLARLRRSVDVQSRSPQAVTIPLVYSRIRQMRPTLIFLRKCVFDYSRENLGNTFIKRLASHFVSV